jgi:hypothetical protein
MYKTRFMRRASDLADVAKSLAASTGHGLHHQYRDVRKKLAAKRARHAILEYVHALKAARSVGLTDVKLRTQKDRDDEREREHAEMMQFGECILKLTRGEQASCCLDRSDDKIAKLCEASTEKIKRAFMKLKQVIRNDAEYEDYVRKHHYFEKSVEQIFSRTQKAGLVALAGLVAGLYATRQGLDVKGATLDVRDKAAKSALYLTNISKKAVDKFVTSLRTLSFKEKREAIRAFLARHVPNMDLTRVKEAAHAVEASGPQGPALAEAAYDAAKHEGLQPWMEASEARSLAGVAELSNDLNNLAAADAGLDAVLSRAVNTA